MPSWHKILRNLLTNGVNLRIVWKKHFSNVFEILRSDANVHRKIRTAVKCESGLHNKQATYFIQKANEFRSSIWIEADDRKINAKSLLGVLSMGITTGTEISLVAEGPDEEAAVKELSAMLVKDIY